MIDLPTFCYCARDLSTRFTSGLAAVFLVSSIVYHVTKSKSKKPYQLPEGSFGTYKKPEVAYMEYLRKNPMSMSEVREIGKLRGYAEIRCRQYYAQVVNEAKKRARYRAYYQVYVNLGMKR